MINKKKRFLANFNTLKAPPRKKKKKTDAEKEAAGPIIRADRPLEKVYSRMEERI